MTWKKKGQWRRDEKGVAKRGAEGAVEKEGQERRAGRRPDWKQARGGRVEGRQGEAGSDEARDKARDEAKEGEWIYGIHPVEEWIRHHTEKIEEVLVNSERTDGPIGRLTKQATEAGLLVRYRPRSFFDRLLPERNHQGVALRCREFEYAEFETLVGGLEGGPLVMLTAIQDPGNLGAILRSARAFGAGGVILSQRDCCGVNETVARASAGATASLPIAQIRNPTLAIRALKEAGWWILGLALEGEVLHRFDLRRPAVFLLGEEGKGLKPSLQKNCDALLRVPMTEGWDSLNVATCGSVVLYEWMRQGAVAIGKE